MNSLEILLYVDLLGEIIVSDIEEAIEN